MYVDRMRTLLKAYGSAEKNNKLFQNSLEAKNMQKVQLDFLDDLHQQVESLALLITEKESEWRQLILSTLEAEIIEGLAWVYQSDGYQVKLNTRVLRGKIHIEAQVSSVFTSDIPGDIRSTQGRLFQQVVSFSALIGVMTLLGIKTLYVDEAFSGASKRNIAKLNGLLEHFGDRGYNIIMIAQDISLSSGIKANRLFLSRSIDNKTSITQEVGP